MGDIARMSLEDEDWLYKQFGVDAEILIDHAWGMNHVQLQILRNISPRRAACVQDRC